MFVEETTREDEGPINVSSAEKTALPTEDEGPINVSSAEETELPISFSVKSTFTTSSSSTSEWYTGNKVVKPPAEYESSLLVVRSTNVMILITSAETVLMVGTRGLKQ